MNTLTFTKLDQGDLLLLARALKCYDSLIRSRKKRALREGDSLSATRHLFEIDRCRITRERLEQAERALRSAP